ncbi:MAG: hypothetical protein HYX55_07150 [Chloroflexi bacterium]|nr:hypothetical protein [Chloroflexota bacterium]
MTDRESMGKQSMALERSLRQGPADEAGYRAAAIDFGTDADGRSRERIRAGQGSVGSVPRRRSRSPLFSYADSIVVLLVLAIVGFAVVQRMSEVGSGQSPRPFATPSPGPSASPIPVPALTETFVSTRNGFSVLYPAGWSVKAATTSWRPQTYVPIGNSALDELKREGEARLVVASQRLALGETEASRIASFIQPYDLGACTLDRASWPQLTVDGQSGYLDVEGCPLPAGTGFSTPDLRFDLVVFTGGRVYEIALDGAVDRAYFEALLATIHLDPAAAIDPPEGT